jgi:hypothetical protein
MRWISLLLLCTAVAACVPRALGQDRIARSPTGAVPGNATNPSPAQAALEQSAAANKYVFIFFWKDSNQQTDKAWSVLQPAINKMADSATVVSIQTTSPTEKAIVDRFGVSRAPMPLVMAIAPCGAITKTLTGTFNENQLHTAFVSPCTQLCLKALQNRKLVLIYVSEQADQTASIAMPQGVHDFKADKQYGAATEVLLLNASDQAESGFLKDLQLDTNSAKPKIVFIAPPASIIGVFDAAITKQQLVAKLVSAQSNPCAGGKCGPNGCGPKK